MSCIARSFLMSERSENYQISILLIFTNFLQMMIFFIFVYNCQEMDLIESFKSLFQDQKCLVWPIFTYLVLYSAVPTQFQASWNFFGVKQILS